MASTFKEEIIKEVPYIVAIGVSDQDGLRDVMERLVRKGIRFVAYHEPDFGMGLSAIATVPLNKRQRRQLSMYPLWTFSRDSSDEERPALNREVGDSSPSHGVCAGIAQ